MLNFIKKSPSESQTLPEKKNNFFSRLKIGLHRTRGRFSESLSALFLGKKTIDAALLKEMASSLLLADVGVEATNQIISDLTKKIERNQLNNGEALFQTLKEELISILLPVQQALMIPPEKKPFVILTLGVNGVGKTTTIGKLAHYYNQENKKILLAAGDTFRAAAVEQLKIWGERNHIPVIAQHAGADSAAVIFDALQAAKARQTDILFADTAGRLHNKENLMEELKKVVRVMKKIDDTAPHEVLLVLDATTGQNALVQAQQFRETMNVTGLVL
ncbi:MAG: signal recognition particle-docking protein FtsY, partial [Gammaproteobacteria bacterium RIFCSPHIGHO2_12_FULL_40_19]